MNATAAKGETHEPYRWISQAGLDCAVNWCDFGYPRGHWCGYVRVLNDSPLFGLSYSAELPDSLEPALERVMQGPVGKRGVMSLLCASKRVEMLFDVHGSLTFGNSYAPGQPEADGEWWFGFDCGHCDDKPEIQNAPYTQSECESLARQIVALSMVHP